MSIVNEPQVSTFFFGNEFTNGSVMEIPAQVTVFHDVRRILVDFVLKTQPNADRSLDPVYVQFLESDLIPSQRLIGMTTTSSPSRGVPAEFSLRVPTKIESRYVFRVVDGSGAPDLSTGKSALGVRLSFYER